MTKNRLSAAKVRTFLHGSSLDCFDPVSGDLAATIRHDTDWTCHAAMADGTSDQGQYGFEDDLYWTQYSWFRGGGTFHFYLERVDADTCQAYFMDGKIAFLQRIKR